MRGRVQRVANDNVSRSYTYDSYSRLNRETVTIDSLTRSSSFSYDDYHRPTAVTYHGGEVVTTVSFTERGTHTLRGYADDSIKTTPIDVTVTVR